MCSLIFYMYHLNEWFDCNFISEKQNLELTDPSFQGVHAI